MNLHYRRVEVVGPRVSGELLSYGRGWTDAAIVAILIYLWFRFEWQFALGAMIANGARHRAHHRVYVDYADRL